jgi:hypothetical protein
VAKDRGANRSSTRMLMIDDMDQIAKESRQPQPESVEIQIIGAESKRDSLNGDLPTGPGAGDHPNYRRGKS